MVLSSEPGTSLVAEQAALLTLIADGIEWVAGCRQAQGPRPWPRTYWVGTGMSSLFGEIGQVWESCEKDTKNLMGGKCRTRRDVRAPCEQAALCYAVLRCATVMRLADDDAQEVRGFH